MFAGEIRAARVAHMRQFTHWRWHLDEVYVKINGEIATCGAPSIMRARCWNPWHHEAGQGRGAEILRRGYEEIRGSKRIVTDGLRSYGAR